MRYLTNCLLALACLSTAFLSAQTLPSTRQGEIPTLVMPVQNNAQLMALELEARKPGRAPQFANVLDVDVRPTTHGEWNDNGDGTSTWMLRLSSPGAYTLNLGFTEYWMPAGGELFLTTGKKENWDVLGPFTPADNETHNELWTPILDGDQLIIEVRLPTAEQANLRLWLTNVGHDYLGFNQKSVSGSCNIDVVCADEDGWGIVDGYRDIIRSVAVMSRGGGTFCTGFLVNNVRQDGTPYFMTANHCGMNAGNAASLVTYWNFENTTCRVPGSGASGGGGDGVLSTNNTGSVWRASNPASDMTIVEMDDPINPDADAFFAGWDFSYDVPLDTVIGIHHPSTDEKRITFTFQQTYYTNGFNGPADVAGTHLHIPDWDLGTTEPGSSGSPVFDKNRRIRGQLHGGQAACGNDAYDTYGSFARSWEGGGTPSSRLRDWLDPDDTGVTFIDGVDVNAPQTTVFANPVEQNVCSPESSTYSVILGAGFATDVQLNIEDLPAGLSASYSQNPATPGSTITLTITPDAGLEGNFAFNLSGTDGAETDQVSLQLNVASGVPAITTQISPAADESNVSLTPVLSWDGTAGTTYEYQLAIDANFSTLLATGTADDPNITLGALEEGTNYFWRVRTLNDCGNGEWSTSRNFVTLALSCQANETSANVPVTISGDGTDEISSALNISQEADISAMEVNVEISHSYIGDLIVTLISPDGVEVILFDRIGVPASGFGCPGDNLNLSFDDNAAMDYAALEATCGGGAITAEGLFQPLESLTAFNNESPLGDWTLRVNDEAGGDAGALQSWGIAFCNASATLPVQLSKFTAVNDGCDVIIDWAAALEDNFDFYQLEVSADGRRFTTIAKEHGGKATYQFVDEAVSGTNFYRLKMVDLDNTSAYSEVIVAANECGKPAVTSIFPNPTAGGELLTVQFDRPLAEGTVFRIYSADGRQLRSQTVAAGLTTHTLDVDGLPTGTYFLRAVTGSEVVTKGFVVSR
jgi:subtilisin-like proprotein convertase family protein